MKNNTKVEGRGNNLKLKAQSLKREFISRFQLLIIYINFMQKTNKKVGETRVQSCGLKLRMMGVMIFTLAAVWFFAGARGAASSALLRTAKEAWFRLKTT